MQTLSTSMRHSFKSVLLLGVEISSSNGLSNLFACVGAGCARLREEIECYNQINQT